MKAKAHTMKAGKKKQLEAKGFKVGDAREFLRLSPEEVAYIELKIALGKEEMDSRKAKDLTQTDLARLIKSSQSRIAKMEAGDPSVSIDLLIRTLFILGTSRKQLAKVVS